LAAWDVSNCCAVGYTSYVGKKKDLSFFRFPVDDKERCSRWEAAVRRHDYVNFTHNECMRMEKVYTSSLFPCSCNFSEFYSIMSSVASCLKFSVGHYECGNPGSFNMQY
jgi:hypothetical protein